MGEAIGARETSGGSGMRRTAVEEKREQMQQQRQQEQMLQQQQQEQSWCVTSLKYEEDRSLCPPVKAVSQQRREYGAVEEGRVLAFDFRPRSLESRPIADQSKFALHRCGLASLETRNCGIRLQRADI